MDPKLAAAVAARVRGVPMNVTAVSAELGITAKTFHKYVRRFSERGVEGLYPDSRRPRTSPTRLPVECEDVLVRVRKEEAEAGWDFGAEAVLMRLEREPGLWPFERTLPSRATVNRVFESRGQLVKVPRRRPHRTRRFERERVNELWQYDGFAVALADGGTATVLHLTDDCSRVDLALQAVVSENATDVWVTFCLASARYGLPAAVLSDNGTAFSGRRRGWSSQLESRLESLGIRTITSRVAHPQTCGKNERAHQRVLKWLDRRPPARDLSVLQALLDEYRDAYNTRPNRVLDRLTPHQRFDLGPLATPLESPHRLTHLSHHTVTTSGSIGLQSYEIGLGRRHAGRPATTIRCADHVIVFVDDQLVRDFTLDHTRRYQPQQH